MNCLDVCLKCSHSRNIIDLDRRQLSVRDESWTEDVRLYSYKELVNESCEMIIASLRYCRIDAKELMTG